MCLCQEGMERELKIAVGTGDIALVKFQSSDIVPKEVQGEVLDAQACRAADQLSE